MSHSKRNITDLGDYLGLFNLPQAAPTGQMGAPVFAQQVPAGQPAAPAPPQGMVQVGMSDPSQQVQAPQAPAWLQAPQAPQVPQQAAQPPAPPVPPQAPVSVGSVGQAGGGVDTTAALLQQNEAYRAQLAQYEAQEQTRREQEEQARISSLPKLDQINARLEILQKSQQTAVQRAQEYQVAYERERIMNEHEGRLDPTRLDLSSVEALRASVPGAQQAYMQFEDKVAQRLMQQYGLSSHIQVEGLPPSPQVAGLPTSNRGGAVPHVPGVPMQAQHQTHPQLQRDNALQYTPNPAYGRVFQPAPGSMPAPQAAPNGQYFQPNYTPPPHQQQMAQPSPQVTADQAALSEARNSILAARSGGMNRLKAMGMAEPSSSALANANQGAQRVTTSTLPDPIQFAGAANLNPMHLASGGH